MFDCDNLNQIFERVLTVENKLGKHPTLYPNYSSTFPHSTNPSCSSISLVMASPPLPSISSPTIQKTSYLSFHKCNTDSFEECPML
jgi:hypothetical protein